MFLVCRATPYSKLRCKLLCLPSYPQSPVHVELDSPTLPDMVVAKLQKLATSTVCMWRMCCAARSTPCAPQASSTPASGQMAAVVGALNRMLRENKLLMAMDEVMSLRKYAKSTQGVELKVLDGKGVVKATVTQGQYHFAVRVVLRLRCCRCRTHALAVQRHSDCFLSR